jgi:hypothetical protein
MIIPVKGEPVYLGEISGSHVDEYEDDCLLGCCACTLTELDRLLKDATTSVIALTRDSFYQTATTHIQEDNQLLVSLRIKWFVVIEFRDNVCSLLISVRAGLAKAV